MPSLTLTHIALFLAAAAIAAPLAKALRIGTVLGYLIAGVLIGPFGLGGLSSGLGIGDLYSAQAVLHLAEFGIVLLLFLIGLELRLSRLWAMRRSIFGAGGVQVGVTGIALALIGTLLGLNFLPALFMGLALALSSTAFALQVMEENGELTARHGRLGFAILLFRILPPSHCWRWRHCLPSRASPKALHSGASRSPRRRQPSRPSTSSAASSSTNCCAG